MSTPLSPATQKLLEVLGKKGLVAIYFVRNKVNSKGKSTQKIYSIRDVCRAAVLIATLDSAYLSLQLAAPFVEHEVLLFEKDQLTATPQRGYKVYSISQLLQRLAPQIGRASCRERV